MEPDRFDLSGGFLVVAFVVLVVLAIVGGIR